MTTKRSETRSTDETASDPRGKQSEIEERRRRREEATTVDGTESHQPEDSEAVKAQEAATDTGGYGTGSDDVKKSEKSK